MRRVFLLLILICGYCNAQPPIYRVGVETDFPLYHYEKISYGERLINIDCPISNINSINFTRALILAVCNSQSLASLYADLKIKEAELGETQSLYYPKIQFSASRINAKTTFPNSTSPTINNESEPKQLSTQLLLYDFGQRENRLAISKHGVNSSVANYYNGLLSVIDNAANYFFQRNKSLIVYDESQKKDRLLNVLLKITTVREQMGQAKIQDVLKIKNEIDQNSTQSLKYKEELYRSSIDLFQMLEIEYDENLHFDYNSIYESSIDVEVDQLVDKSLTVHPLLVSIMEKWLSDKKNIELAKALAMPVIDFKGNFYINGRSDQSNTSNNQSRERNLNFTMTVPIFDGYANQSKVISAIAQSEKTMSDWLLQEQRIKKEVVYNYVSYTNTQSNLELKNHIVENNRKIAVASLIRFNRGIDNLSEVINLLSLFIDSEIEALKAQVELKQAEVKLLLSAGYFEDIFHETRNSAMVGKNWTGQ